MTQFYVYNLSLQAWYRQSRDATCADWTRDLTGAKPFLDADDAQQTADRWKGVVLRSVPLRAAAE